MINKNDQKVSVIIPVYNVEAYIEKCIMSIINQSYQNIEIIIVNDGSTDHSYDVVKKIKEETKEERILILEQPNSGVSIARNKGLEIATGEYIIFVDADDFLANDCIEYMLSLINYDNGDFAFSIENFKKKNEKQTEKLLTKNISSNEAIFLLLGLKVTVGCWNKIYSRKMLIDNKIKFLPDLFYGEGLSFIIRVSKIAKKITIGNKKVYYYRKNNNTSATTKYNNIKYHNGEKALHLIGESIDLSDNMIKSSYSIHLCTFYLGAIVKIIENHKRKEHKEDYKKWKMKMKKHFRDVYQSKYVSMYRKLMIFGGIYFPYIVAILDKRRNKKIFSSSV